MCKGSVGAGRHFVVHNISTSQIVAQPGMQQQIEWVPTTERISGCPPGLEYLTQIDQMLIHQMIELFEGRGKREIRIDHGDQILRKQ